MILLLVPPGAAQSLCEESLASSVPPPRVCPAIDPPLSRVDPIAQRLVRYAKIEAKHRLCGLASYYSRSLDGSLTATGEVFRNRRFTAAHLTLPLGTWVEVRARATGKVVRVLVNDRGPYAKKFCLDLSQAAAHALGVDVAEDRHVDIRIIALPGEEPMTETELAAAAGAMTEESTER